MMIWKTDFNLDVINAMSKNTIIEYLNIRLTERGDDYLRATMPVNQTTVQPLGLLHGGASCVLAETLGSYASTMCLENTDKSSIVGIEINANHLRSAKEGIVTGTVHPIKIGKRIHVWAIDIHDNQGRLICTSRLTTMVI